MRERDVPGSISTPGVVDDRAVVVVGGGQAGPAIGYLLAEHGRDFVILEAADEPAAAWCTRRDSLKLFTPVRYSSGLPFRGDPDSCPTRDDVAAHVTRYARHRALPVPLGSRGRSIRQSNHHYLVALRDRCRRKSEPGPSPTARPRPRFHHPTLISA